MSIESEIIKIEAELEEQAILADKSEDYKEGFNAGIDFLAKIYRKLWDIWTEEFRKYKSYE